MQRVAMGTCSKVRSSPISAPVRPASVVNGLSEGAHGGGASHRVGIIARYGPPMVYRSIIWLCPRLLALRTGGTTVETSVIPYAAKRGWTYLAINPAQANESEADKHHKVVTTWPHVLSVVNASERPHVIIKMHTQSRSDPYGGSSWKKRVLSPLSTLLHERGCALRSATVLRDGAARAKSFAFFNKVPHNKYETEITLHANEQIRFFEVRGHSQLVGSAVYVGYETIRCVRLPPRILQPVHAHTPKSSCTLWLPSFEPPSLLSAVYSPRISSPNLPGAPGRETSFRPTYFVWRACLKILIWSGEP